MPLIAEEAVGPDAADKPSIWYKSGEEIEEGDEREYEEEEEM